MTKKTNELNFHGGGRFEVSMVIRGLDGPARVIKCPSSLNLTFIVRWTTPQEETKSESERGHESIDR